MRSIGLFFTLLLLVVACNTNQQQPPVAATDSNQANAAIPEGDDYWAKDNFDLQRAGDLLERSNSPEEFEGYINEPNGINNLDLNGDGYTDYVSVEEFPDRDPNSRGLSLVTRFGPGLVQEIAQVLLYRDEPRYPGARVLFRGDDRIYGDNQFYEANWLDRSLGLASMLFSDRPSYYRSPYYYDNYPNWYQPYAVVDTPVYRTRIVELYPRPLFVYNAAPLYWSKIKIKSGNNGLHLGQLKARLVKPTKEQAEWYRLNPRGKFDKFHAVDKPGRPDPPRSDRGDERGNPAKSERGAERGNPGKPAARKIEHQSPKSAKPGNPNKGAGNPDKGSGGGKGGGKGKGKP